MPNSAHIRTSLPRRALDSLRSSLHATGYVTLALLICLAFVLGLATLLNYSKFLTTYTELTDRRVELVTRWSRDSIELLLNLGLELHGLEAAPGILDQARYRYPHIESISLFDTANGRILYSTSSDLVGTTAPAEWLNQQKEADGPSWHYDHGDPAVAGIRLDSSFLKGLGGIAITYSTAETHRKIAATRDQLVLSALAVFAIYGVIAVICALLVTRGMRRTLTGLGDVVDPASEGRHEGKLPEQLRAPAADFRQATASAMAALAAAESELVDGEEAPPKPLEEVRS